MKRLINDRPVFVSGLMCCAALIALWVVWFFRYRHFLIWMEGFSFFSAIPDYTGIMLTSFGDIPQYIGAFLLQFYKFPVLGALVQALIPVGITMCAMVVTGKLCRDSGASLWSAFLLLPIAIYLQLGDLDLSRTITMLLITSAFALASASVSMFMRGLVSLPKFLRYPILSLAVPVVAISMSVYILTDNEKLGRYHEEVAELEYLAEKQDWDAILHTVSRQDALRNNFARRYVLLALSETGRLPDYAFSYGLSGADDFLFQQEDFLFCRSFNVLFYRSLKLANPAVYHSYHYSLQPSYGVCFDSVRYLADMYIAMKDYTLAKKYIDILSHSTCHGKWINDRMPALNRIKDNEPSYVVSDNKFIFSSFVSDMTSLVQRYPDNRKFTDYLLCATLAEKDADAFLRVFRQAAYYHYNGTSPVPRLYQEALLLIASQNPDILKTFKIEKKIWDSFVDFTDMMQKGRTADAKRKYADTYWAYVY